MESTRDFFSYYIHCIAIFHYTFLPLSYKTVIRRWMDWRRDSRQRAKCHPDSLQCKDNPEVQKVCICVCVCKAYAVTGGTIFLAQAHLHGSRTLPSLYRGYSQCYVHHNIVSIYHNNKVTLKMIIIGVFLCFGNPLFLESWCMLALAAFSSTAYYREAR